MQHDDRRLDAFGKFKSLERVLDGQFAVARALGGKFVEVRRGVLDTQRQRTEIMQSGNFDFARSTASRMPGMRLTRMPWLNSA